MKRFSLPRVVFWGSALILTSLTAHQPFLSANTDSRLTITVDNKYIQTYRGRMGRWMPRSAKSLQAYASEFQTTVTDIVNINDHELSRCDFIFVPMSNDVYQSLLKQGFGRRILNIDPRRYIWPSESPVYTSRFGRRFSENHSGLDVAAPMSTPVLAVDDGEVVGSAWMGGLGKAVMIIHADGMKTVYGHNNDLLLKVGEKVSRGQIIAYSGSTGRSTGPHMHFEVRFQEIAMNPEDFLPYGYHQSEIIVREDAGGIAVQETLPDIRASSSLSPDARIF